VEIDLDKLEGRPQRPLAPRIPSGRSKTQVGISIAAEILVKLDARAKKRGLSRSGVVNMAVTESLERWERQEREQG
jgi:metal-responsive CopG/Arc/MetJ family transcriptional regulator